MPEGSPASEEELPWERDRKRVAPRVPHLVLAWSLDEPERLGESIAVDRRLTVGRGGPLADDPAPRAVPVRFRPGEVRPCDPIDCSRIARVHLTAEPKDGGIRLRSLARAELRIDGRTETDGIAREGDVVELHNAAVFLVVSRPKTPAPFRGDPPVFSFGSADPFGIVGESEAAWALRESLAFAAGTSRHVLLFGESGAGKELAARALHGLSNRARRPLVSRSAATLPASLVDAELFGNAKNYPNAGMPERPGLLGEADGSTLFLDEIGELPESSQTHLLRVLDGGGEYTRLGESQSRASAFRLVAATNRDESALKHDVLARFTHRITVPGLANRREDVPLVLRALLARIAAENPSIASRFFERRRGVLAEAKIAPSFVVRLLRHRFSHHVRELDRLTWLAIGSAEDDYIGVTEAVDAELDDADSGGHAEITKDALEKAIAELGHRPTQLTKALGLKNRYVLHRLLKKHGLSEPRGGDG
ncbi:MAG TPA: sigma 54-interacting transcriptional regulator [Polyangiaceae bacterium]|nr:sigma 54-interacting transcriptional regulator [Polyangiaceae bacterium]